MPALVPLKGSPDLKGLNIADDVAIYCRPLIFMIA